MQNLLRLSYEKILLLASVNLRDDYRASGDFAHKMADNARLVEEEDVTFYMELDPA